MTMWQKNKYKQNIEVGDKVQFGRYADFNNASIYEVIEIKTTIECLGDIMYRLKNDNGEEITAFIDEVRKI